MLPMCMMRAGTMSQCEHDYCQWQCMSVGKKAFYTYFTTAALFSHFKSIRLSTKKNPHQHSRDNAPFPYEHSFSVVRISFDEDFFYFSKTFICNLSADWIGNRLYGTRLIIIIIFNYTRSSFVSDETLKSAFGEITSPFLQASPFIFRGMNLVN